MTAVSVGSVTMQVEEHAATAELLSNGTWRLSGEPGLMQHLQACCSVIDTSPGSPSEGRYGYSQLSKLAELTRGTMSLPALKEHPRRIY